METTGLPNLNYRRPVFIGLLALLVLFGGTIAWAAYANISGAVIATGSVVVEGKPKSVQHLDGGIVENIFVSPGDRVKKGDVLVELDRTNIAANLSIYKTRLRDALVRKERLLAELNGAETFSAPDRLAELYDLGDLTPAIEQQKSLMAARDLTRRSQLEQLDEKINQFRNQIEGSENLSQQKSVQTAKLLEERDGLVKLVERKVSPKSRLLANDRAIADMRGQIAELTSDKARLKNSISETRISKLQVDRQFREKVANELEQTDVKIDELRQQIDATSQQLHRIAIRAPVDGIVHELNVFTIGGIVQPGQVIMQVIPSDGKHEIELTVDTSSIDQLFIGQKCNVRFPAFHQRTTPELKATIKSISPSSVVDEKRGLSFYRVNVSISTDEMAKLTGKTLVPGMPVEGFIPTEERSVLSYLVKPLSDQLSHAFREE